jgi:hypothetical protein
MVTEMRQQATTRTENERDGGANGKTLTLRTFRILAHVGSQYIFSRE